VLLGKVPADAVFGSPGVVVERVACAKRFVTDELSGLSYHRTFGVDEPDSLSWDLDRPCLLSKLL
jgi:hypothetical protein